MTDIVSIIGLVIIVLFLLSFIWKERKEFRHEQGRLIDAVLARNVQDLAIADAIRNEKKPEEQKKEEDLSPLDTADDDVFTKIIQQQLQQKQGDTGEEAEDHL